MAELGARVDNLEDRFDAQGQDLAGIRQSVTRLEGRVERVEDRLVQVEDRIGRIEDRVVRLEDKMERRFEFVDDAIRSLGTEMHVNFRWIMGGIGGAVLAILLAIVGAVAAIL